MHLTDMLPHPDDIVFHAQDEVRDRLRAACAAHADVAAFFELGKSEEGRPIDGVVIGSGPRTVGLVAGSHADEPVGPETLRTFILQVLEHRERFAQLLEAYRFVIVPHTNPDGEARNRRWIERWPDPQAFLAHVERELPGRDVEFGYPAMRVENRLVGGFLRQHAPFSLYASLHGMAYSEGAMLLIERHWAFRTQRLREGFTAAAAQAGLRLHDHNRKGEKGFFYIEPGFTTTPEGAAMRHYFLAQGDEDMARRFHDSSMEFVRSLGGDPLCIVTELPLFVVARPEGGHEPGVPAVYLDFKARLPELKLRVQQGQSVQAELEAFALRALDLPAAMRLQLAAIDLALDAL